MKTLTVKQPWASLVVEGIKDIENRTWKCPEKYIGQRVLIHASGKMDFANPLSALNDSQRLCFPTPESRHKLLDDSTIRSAIIGSVEIVGCVINHPSIWAEKTEVLTDKDGFPVYGEKTYNWILANPIKFPEPIPAKGKLGFWEFEPDQKYMECTNENPYTHRGQGEREGCIQDCSNCDYYKLIYDQLS